MGKLDKPAWAESPELAEAAKIAKQEAKKKRKQQKLDEAVTRIQPAKALRERVREIRLAPHGPLASAGFGGSASGASIIPKWAACPHCAGAVEVAKCKPATQKNFDDGPQIQGFASLSNLAGLLGDVTGKGKKKEEEEEEEGQKKKKVGLPDVEVASEADTEERLYAERDEYAKQLTKLQEDFNKLDDENEKLQEETDAAKKEMEELREKLLIAEGSEKLWRDKYAAARMEKDAAEIAQKEAEAAQHAAEEECELMTQERNDFKDRLDRVTRRKGLQLDGIQAMLGEKEEAARLRPPMLLWKVFSSWQREVKTLKEGQEAMAAELERTSAELTDVSAQLAAEKKETARLTDERIQCGVRLLERKFPTHERAYLKSTWSAWNRIHPQLKLENEIHRLTEITQSSARIIADQKERVESLETLVNKLEDELKTTKTQRDAFEDEVRETKLRYEQQLADERVAHQFQIGALEEKRVKDVERKEREIREEAQEEIDAMAVRLEDLEGLIDELERKADATRGPGQKRQQGVRVVPRNKGIVCVSCLRQLLIRDVKPMQKRELERVATSPQKIRDAVSENRASTAGAVSKRGTLPALNPKYPEEVEKRRFKFFENELNGVLDPGDPLHQLMWSSHADPFDGLGPAIKGLGRPKTVGRDRAQSPDWVREWK